MSRALFILASSSPRRLMLLKDIGIVPDKIMAAEIDETPKPQELPRALAERLALEKLHAVSSTEKNAVILAADTVVGVGRRVLPKAKTENDVFNFLRLMAGRRHHVYTGVAVQTPEGKVVRRLSDSTVIFRQMSDQEIRAYAQTGEGIGKAGGYAIQGRASAYIRFISGSYSGIVGLPLFEVAQLAQAVPYAQNKNKP